MVLNSERMYAKVRWDAMPQAERDALTIQVPDGYNGHTVTCSAQPVFTGRSIVHLQTVGKRYTRWAHMETWLDALARAFQS